VRKFLAVLIVSELLAAVGVLGVREYRGTTHVTTGVAAATTSTTEGFDVAPAGGQTLLRGRVASITGDGLTPPALALPLTIDAQNVGQTQATFRAVLVNGKRTNIYWNGGRPLPLKGQGGIDVFGSGGAHASIDAKGVTWLLDGADRQLQPGSYTTGFTVGVGTGGLVTPHDEAVTFQADGRSTVTTKSGAVVHQPPSLLKLTGPGSFTLAGALVLRTAGGTRTATLVQFGPGPFVLELTPVAGGYRVVATLQGPVA
jgi:hypothetical protein